jgi:hypothetical protein
MRRERNSSRPSWLAENLYLLTGLLIGLGLGLLYAWVISPVKYVDTSPASLRADFKDGYRAVIASAYLASGNIERAQSRLVLLGDLDPVQALVNQAQQARSQGDPTNAAYALSMLAEALQQPPTIPATLTPIPPTLTPITPTQTPEIVVTPSETGSPTPTSLVMTPIRTPSRTPTPILPPTPRPSRTATPTLGAPFLLVDQEVICNPAYPEALLQIAVADANGDPVPGMRLTVTWQGGSDTFYTGLKPDLGAGYADFEMTPGLTYSLQLGRGGSTLVGLSAPTCQDESGEYWGGLYLYFKQP